MSEITGYMEQGEVLVARRETRIVGHLQLVPTGSDWEIKSLAVLEEERGKGIGSALVRAALERVFSAGAVRLVVATATADIVNLRFYQLLGFRMDRIVRDAFRPDRGYPTLQLDGIPVCDQVWFSINPALPGPEPL